MALRTVGVKLQAEVSGYVNNLRTANKATRDFVGELDKAAKGGQLDAVTDQAALLGTGLVAAFGFAVNAAAQFDKQMSSVQAATHATTAEMEMLRQAAMEAGKDTSFSAKEAAQAVEELAKAGVSTSNILGGGLSGALDLAAAGQMEVAEAAEIAASALTQFKLAGSDVPHIADLLAAGAGKAQGSVHDMGMALNQAGLVSAQFGLSVEDTVGTLTAFASAGMIGSDAGTSLKTALLMLANPAGETAELMKQLGINAYDTSGQFIGITALAEQLRQKLGHLSQEQRNAAMAQIFGQDAIRAASILYEQGADGIQKWINAVDDQGYAAETARMKTDNLVGDLERLRGELDNLAIQAGSGSSGGLRLLVQSLEAVVGQIGSLPPAVTSTAAALTGLTGAALLLGAGWLKARRTNAEMLAELRATGPAGTRAARGLQVAQRGAARAAGAFIALQLAGAAISAMQKELNPQVEALGKGLAEWGQNGELAGEAARLLGSDMKDLQVGLKFLADTDNSRRKFARWGQDLLETVVPGLDGTNTSLTKTRERVAAMDQALAGLVQAGQADQAAGAFDRLAAAAAEQGVSVEELKALFPAYAGAVETAGSKSGDAAGGIAAVGAEAKTAEDAVNDLKAAFDELFGVEMDYDRAIIAYRDGIKELNKELTTGKRTLDTNTQAGRDNASAVLDQIDRIKELRDARIDQGESIDVVNGKYQSEIGKIRAKLKELGYEQSEIDELIGKYEEIPEQVATRVDAETIQAETNLAKVKTLIAQIRSKKVVITTQHNQVVTRSEGRNVPIGAPGGRASGGSVAAGETFWVGEHGRELVTFASDGFVLNAHRSEQIARQSFSQPTNWWGGWRNFAPQAAAGGATVQVDSAPRVLEAHIEIGGEVVRVVQVQLREHNRAVTRRVGAGAGRQ